MIEFEGEFDKIPNVKYPLCIDGARKCPPEDVGSIPGYYDFLDAIKNKKHPEHESLLEWCDGSYNPEEFEYKKVKFSSPSARLNKMLEDD